MQLQHYIQISDLFLSILFQIYSFITLQLQVQRITPMQDQFPQNQQINRSQTSEVSKNLKLQRINQFKQDSNEIFQENNPQNMNSTFQTNNSLQQRSSEMSTERIQPFHKKSIFHNFQKHLVITLRKNIKIRKSSSKNEPKTIAWQIWSNFLKQSKIYTKNILHILFGVVDYEGSDLTNIYDEQIIEKFGYGEIFSKYPDKMLTKAQEVLRFEVIRQVKKMNMQQLMKKRRLTNTEEFIEYVREFIGQLQQGPMRKRLPKSKKVEMKLENKQKTE